MDKQKRAVEIVREYQLFRRREYTQPHMSYAHEKERHRVITEGRVDQIEEVLAIRPDGTSGTLSEDELRNAKNMFISAITMFTRSAIEGGLPEETAFAMSDSYIQNGEKCIRASEVHQLYEKAFREFTCAVFEKGKKHYSTVIEDVIHFIHIHLHEKITLSRAAEHTRISPCHLSRIFRKETGMSFVDYVQKERVEAAGHMLVYSEYTVPEISEYLHFSTQSYFIKIFRKFKGMTPAVYRKHYRENEKW